MERMKFRTTIKCTGCLEKVTPHLNSTKGIEKWEVELKNPEKVLTVHAQSISEDEVMQVVKKVGYEIEKM
jgi:copper chaperone